MKTKLLKKLRKRFNWKFVNDEGIRTLYIYDKHWLYLYTKDSMEYSLHINDFKYLLLQYGDDSLIKKYNQKKERIKFIKL
jgi:hypothetical protein